VCGSLSRGILIQALNSSLVVLDLKYITIVCVISKGKPIFENLVVKYFGHQKKEISIFWHLTVTVFSNQHSGLISSCCTVCLIHTQARHKIVAKNS
jgi:hypothetical protein